MRHFTILAALILCAAPAAAQTMKALMYSTNGNVIAPNIAFTNQVSVLGVNVAPNGVIQYDGNEIYDMSVNSFVAAVNFDQPAATRANLGFSTNLNMLWTATNASSARSAVGLGATWLTNTNVTNFRTAVGLGATNSATFQAVTTEVMAVGAGTSSYFSADVNMVETALPIEFANNSSAATRTNLGLPLASLTNTSNVTMMRALAGSTNSAHPFSGSFVFVDDAANTWSATVSNGIILSIVEQ